ncbi:ABC transporter [Paragonimus heterotremus]|uniref:ABC transporter n=1 Tax=Paragonimus heterotremus TaxID=100268 RepID=A0A8J4SHW1_9TREM|nr:ABC transporter [Paragonimus heterotremus]
MLQCSCSLFVRRFSCIGWKLNTRTTIIAKSLLKGPKLKSYGLAHRLFNLSSLFGIGFIKLSPFDHFLSPVLCESPKERNSTQIQSANDEWTIKDLFDLLLPETFTIFCAVLSALLAAVMNVLIPLHLGEFVDVLSGCFGGAVTVSYLYTPALKLCGAYLCQSLATFLYIGLLASAGERIAVRLRRALFRSLVYREVAYFDVQNSGKLLESITSDVQTFKSSFKQCISHGLKNTIQVIGSVYALLKISSTLTFTLMGSLPCVVLVGSLMGAELRRLSQNVHSQNSIAASTAEETFTHIRSVKALALEENQNTKFCIESEEARRLNEKLGYGIGLFQGLSNFALNGIVLGVLYVGGHLISRDELKPGDLMSFLVTTQTVQRSLAQLSLLYGHVVRGNSALSRIFGTLRSSAVECNESSLFNRSPLLYTNLCDLWRQPGQAPQLCFDAVQFAYPTRPETFVLNELNMTIPAGKVVALVGHSGAGELAITSVCSYIHYLLRLY